MVSRETFRTLAKFNHAVGNESLRILRLFFSNIMILERPGNPQLEEDLNSIFTKPDHDHPHCKAFEAPGNDGGYLARLHAQGSHVRDIFSSRVRVLRPSEFAP